MPVSVCLSVTFVHCVTGCDGSRISLHAWIDGCLLLTDNASPGSSDGMMPGFPVEEGGYRKIGDCSDITYFTYFLSMDRKHVTASVTICFVFI